MEAKEAGSQPIRINKYLTMQGICSRRQADDMIMQGKVTVDGQTADIGMRVLPTQNVCVNGQPVAGTVPSVLIAVNKPVGIVCTAKHDKDNIVDFLNYPIRLYPIGRLDKASEGLILMTNNGEYAEKIMHARGCHEKEYIVTVDKPVTDEFILQMRTGVHILDTVTRPCTVTRLGEKKFCIVLTQGLNRQIRRMCGKLGYGVRTLQRVRIMNIRLGNLRKGAYRELTEQEWKGLEQLLS